MLSDGQRPELMRRRLVRKIHPLGRARGKKRETRPEMHAGIRRRDLFHPTIAFDRGQQKQFMFDFRHQPAGP